MEEQILIDNTWVKGKKIGKGGFGSIYLATNILNGKMAAIKVEDIRISELLYGESMVIKALSPKEGFPKYHWSGLQNTGSSKYCLIEQLVGPCLQDLFILCGGRFSLKTTILLADQLLERLEYFHKKDFVHRDIKPENFAMGIYENSHICYLLDFNLSRKYRDTKTLNHIPYKENLNMVGTVRYTSVNAHLGIEQSRRDDLESLGYVLIYFLKGYLPWQGLKGNNKQEKYQKILEKKITTPPEILCEDLPDEFCIFLNYVKSLKFDDKPDYHFLRKMFKRLLRREMGENECFSYDWWSPLLYLNLKKKPPGELEKIQNKISLRLQVMIQNSTDFMPLDKSTCSLLDGKKRISQVSEQPDSLQIRKINKSKTLKDSENRGSLSQKKIPKKGKLFQKKISLRAEL